MASGAMQAHSFTFEGKTLADVMIQCTEFYISKELQQVDKIFVIGNGQIFEKKFSKKGGNMQMVQLWVNLPAKDKMTAPKYQNLNKKNITKVELEDNSGTINIIAGQFENHKGPVSTFSPLNLFNINLNKGKGTSLNLPKEHNTGLLITKGSVTINNTEKAPTNHFVLFQNDGTEFTIRADEDSTILMLSGEPIDEPIASYGPFVMNTNAEIRQTIDDFNSGKFGYLD